MLASASIKRMVAGTDGSVSVLPPGLQEGKGWDGTRRPTLIERASQACSEIIGQPYGTLVYSLVEGCRRGHIGMASVRVLLERALPADRPTPVTLPLIDCAADLVEADRRLTAAANVGAISRREWRQGQACILDSWQIRQQARLEEP